MSKRKGRIGDHATAFKPDMGLFSKSLLAYHAKDPGMLHALLAVVWDDEKIMVDSAITKTRVAVRGFADALQRIKLTAKRKDRTRAALKELLCAEHTIMCALAELADGIMRPKFDPIAIIRAFDEDKKG